LDQYCSLAVEVLGGGELDEATLAQILKVCVERRGRWPAKPLKPLDQIVRWAKAKHFANENGGLRATTLLSPLMQLGHKFGQMDPS
jgi:hypothetical protein